MLDRRGLNGFLTVFGSMCDCCIRGLGEGHKTLKWKEKKQIAWLDFKYWLWLLKRDHGHFFKVYDHYQAAYKNLSM